MAHHARLLEEIVQVVLDEINAENNKDFQRSDWDFHFSRDTMTNESENIANEKIKAETQQIQVNTILNIAAAVGDEQTLKAICEIMDFDFEEIMNQLEQIEAEQDTANAKATLEGVVTDEPTAEDSSATIPE